MSHVSRYAQRRFLFLQGPHGPFFAGLAARLRAAGAEVWRMGFNAGDAAFWTGPGYLPHRDGPDAWPDALASHLRTLGITDIVCYGSSRPVHKTALAMATARGLEAHVFEEGYLRPYWVTYERGGANAASPLMDLSVDRMRAALDDSMVRPVEAPDRWGDTRAHIVWGAAYHAILLAGARRYPHFQPHRTPGVGGEFRLYARNLTALPFRAMLREAASARVRHGGVPYHLALLQLAHDANFRDHGPFDSQAAFLRTVMEGFASGAPRHHHLVLKAHPLEDNREPLRPLIRDLTRVFGLQRRVHFIAGGKLARLLDTAQSAVTVNSTAAEQVLWRGLPLKAFGRAVYTRPEFVSDQSLADFFADPKLPDREAYLVYRAFLLATSQVAGGFYAFRSRAKLLRQLPDLLLASESPTERLIGASKSVASLPQALSVVG